MHISKRNGEKIINIQRFYSSISMLPSPSPEPESCKPGITLAFSLRLLAYSLARARLFALISAIVAPVPIIPAPLPRAPIPAEALTPPAELLTRRPEEDVSDRGARTRFVADDGSEAVLLLARCRHRGSITSFRGMCRIRRGSGAFAPRASRSPSSARCAACVGYSGPAARRSSWRSGVPCWWTAECE